MLTMLSQLAPNTGILQLAGFLRVQCLFLGQLPWLAVVDGSQQGSRMFCCFAYARGGLASRTVRLMG